MITQILQILFDAVIVVLLIRISTQQNNSFDFIQAMLLMHIGAIKAHIEPRSDGGFDVICDEGSVEE